jgi:hypothetical protein
MAQTITDEQFTEWLSSPTAVRCICVAMEHSSGFVYISNHPYTSTPTDDDSNRQYDDVLVGAISLRESIEKSTISDIHTIADNNNIAWLDYSWIGYRVYIYLGDIRWSFNNFRQVAKGRNGGISAPSTDKYSFTFLDSHQEMKIQIGTKLRPTVIGNVFNCRPVLTDAANKYYRASDRPSLTSIVVRDNGVVLTGGGVGYTLRQDTASNLYDGSRIELVNNNVGQITFDAVEPNNTISKAIQRVCKLVPVNRYLDYNKGGASAFASTTPYTFTDFDAIIDLHANDWTQAVGPALIVDGPLGSGSNFFWAIDPTGLLTFSIDDGLTPYYATVALSETNGTRIRLRFLFVRDTGAGNFSAKFYRSDNGVNWSQVGDEITGPTVAPVTALSLCSIGSNSGLGYKFAGKIFRAVIYDGDHTKGGVIKRDVDPTSYQKSNSWVSDTDGETVTLWNYGQGSGEGFRVWQDGIARNLANLNAFPNTDTIGLFVDKPTSAEELIRQIAATGGGSFRFNSDGELEIFRLDVPGTSVLSIDPDEILSIQDSGLTYQGSEEPVSVLDLGYKKNWSVQPADSLAGAVSVQDREDFSTEYRWVEKANSLGKFPTAKPKVVHTLFESQTNAQTEADRRQVIRKDKRDLYLVKTFLSYGQVKLGETVTITYPDYGFDDGVKCVVLDIDRHLGKNRIDMIVWK